MPRQGIRPKPIPSLLIQEYKNDLREKEFRENSLKQYGEGNILGILRLCARPASGTHAPLSMTDQKGLSQTETLPKIQRDRSA